MAADPTTRGFARSPRLLAPTLAALGFVGLLLEASSASEEPACYRFGAFPFVTALRLEQIFAPLAARLGAELGCPMSYATAPDFDRFEELLTQARFDFAFVQPLDYVRFAAPAGYAPLAAVDGRIEAIFVAHRERGPASLSGLRGCRLGLPPVQSAVSLLARRTLLAAGLTPGSDVELVHYRTHDACLQAVLASEVDSCAAARPPLEAFESTSRVSLRRIAESDSFPAPLIVAHERVDDAAKGLVRDRLLDPSFASEVIAYIDSGFAPARDGDYEPVRELWRRSEAVRSGPLAQLHFGVYPSVPLSLIEDGIAPQIALLSEVAGIPVRLQSASTRERFAARLEIGTYDLAFVDPLDYVRVARTIGYVPLLRYEAALAATFYASPGGGIHTLADLRGRRVAFPPPRSVLARLAHCALREAGLDPDRDLERVVTTSHDACLGLLGRDRVAACASDDALVALIAPKHELRSIGRSIEVAPAVLAAHPRVPAALQRELRDALVRWTPERSQAMPGALFGRWIEASDDDYAAVRRLEAGECPGDLRQREGA